ncbi:hypothetical protein CA13_45180 [Planctomycetes bacterium CA13]|uniref:Uncharacterized protein n=1 Tax=Novipirellula herctigrandis TaxID=2527986 RepID=A0A5C5Z755_9BACT|nr:hypothetical protein CA13_45180 [Planctomycetes bacterium CA13]
MIEPQIHPFVILLFCKHTSGKSRDGGQIGEGAPKLLAQSIGLLQIAISPKVPRLAQGGRSQISPSKLLGVRIINECISEGRQRVQLPHPNLARLRQRPHMNRRFNTTPLIIQQRR